MAVAKDAMRKKFEAWLQDRAESIGEDWSDHDFERSSEDSQCYQDSHIQAGWAAWQEAVREAKEQLASTLVSQLSLVRGRPVEWHEAIEISAIVSGMSDEEKQRLLAFEDA
ncbi:hypothetical protein [Pseudomonas promysalinigenes]|uniref:Uncharacterized protein n=1 Tax=Pseudomonas promysalinigenes TaxID=485898 RepID=A0ABY6AQJ3_9PSED|nr:hypothetical protein [Pseudomonas promysalinigenes]UXH41578.1 hypothetical protein N5C08_08665 [Pseudomonas promysalinigenes]